MITHTIDSYRIPSQKQEKVNVTITYFKNLPKIWNFAKKLHMTHLLKLLDKKYKYEMNPASIVEDTEWIERIPSTDGQMDRGIDG